MGVGRAFVTGLGGLNAFSQAVGYISDNLANVSTTGFKRVDADFQSFTTRSTQRYHDPGGVTAVPVYRNANGGQVVNSDNPTSFAVADGSGFAPVRNASNIVNGTATLSSSLQLYTRATDFSVDANGYLVNSTGQFLMGLQETTYYGGATTIPGTPSLGNLVGVRVDPTIYKSLPGAASTTIDLNANFPADVAAGATATSQLQFYDSLGKAQTLDITYTKSAAAANTWDITAVSVTGAPAGTTVTIGGAAVPVAGALDFTTAGALQTPANGQLSYDIAWPATYGPTTPQSVVVDYGEAATATQAATGSTQYSGTNLEVRSVGDQTGRSPGSFQKASMDKSGYVVFSYSNGQQLSPYRIPLISFSNPDKLQRVSGSTFSADDPNAGKPVARWSGEGDAGRIIPSASEQSNVDIGEELTKMIVAQRAYSSNGKVISSADEMIQEVLNLKR
jgi:flagellar hook protein FlgE